jgi:signal transduction histidine kinase
MVPIEEKAAIARDQILRCRGITQHFLRLSRGQTPLGAIVEIGSVVDAVTRLVEPTARAHSIEIRVSPIDPEVRVRADEADLQHAIVNLLLNAIQACAPGSTVSVEVKADPRVQVRVTDEGSGVPPEDLRRIFEPFFSLREGGTGLGLFLSLNFVRRWGGDIRAESVLNEGSTFWIDLPPLDVGAQPEVAS